MTMMNYNKFKQILNETIFEKSKADLLTKIANSPSRYIGLFRPTKPKAKLLQNLLQSHEIRFGDAFEIIIEEYLRGMEVSCGVLGNEVLPVIEIVPKNEFFDYESKYTESGAQEICPARISKKLSERIQKLALKVFETIKGKGYARVDFIIKNDKPYILEINTLPGMTATSLLPKEALTAGMSYSQLLDKIIELAQK